MMWAFCSEDARKALAARGQFVQALKMRARHDADFSACELIFGELVGNVIQHAPGGIRIVLDWNADEAILCVEDYGSWFHFDATLPANPLAETGRGLYLISALAKHIVINRSFEVGKVIRVVLPLRPVDGPTHQRAVG